MSEPTTKPDRKTGRHPIVPPLPPGRRRSWLLIILVALALAMLFSTFSNRGTEVIAYSELKEHIRQGHVEEISLSPSRVEAIPVEGAADEDVQRWRAVRVEDDEELVPLIEEMGITLFAREESACGSGLIWFWILPLLFLLIFWGAMLRRMGGGTGTHALSFGKAKFKLYVEEDIGVTFGDVAGCEEVIQELHEVVEFLKEPERFYRLGGRIPKGVLLVGPPGTGKTLVARAVAGEAAVPFFNLSGSDFVEMFVGVGAARVRDLFEQAQKLAPCIIFIDELDAIGKARGAGGPMSGNDEREQTLNALLVEMDGFAPKQSVIILAATNRPEILDPALLRPGRFDRQVLVDRPDIRGRLEILEVHSKGLVLGDDLDLEKIAGQTPGFVGADLANIVNEAALLAARRRKDKVEQDDFQDAIERVIAGLEKKNRRMNAVEKQIVAYHEAGHAVAAAALPFADPVHKVSIIPRGIGALGYTLQVPLEDRYLMTQQELLDKIGGLLGGRAAETVIFGDVSTGAQNDLLRATDIARSMVMEYGMSDRLGAVHLGDTSSHSNFLANPFAQRRQISNKTAEAIDKEIQQIVENIRVKVVSILEVNLDVLKTMARRLLETEVIDGDRLHELLARVVAIDEDQKRAQRYRSQTIDIDGAASEETENTDVESDGSNSFRLPLSTDTEHSPSD